MKGIRFSLRNCTKWALFLVFTIIFLPGQVLALKTFDNFDSGALNTTRWSESHQGDAANHSLTFSGGEVILSATTPAGGTDYNSVSLFMTDNAAIGSEVTEFNADLRVTEIISDTQSNDGLAAAITMEIYLDEAENLGFYARIIADHQGLTAVIVEENDGIFTNIYEWPLFSGNVIGELYNLGIKYTGSLVVFTYQGTHNRDYVGMTFYEVPQEYRNLADTTAHNGVLAAEAGSWPSGPCTNTGTVNASFDNVQINYSTADYAGMGGIDIINYYPLTPGNYYIYSEFWLVQEDGETKREDSASKYTIGDEITFNDYQVIPVYENEDEYDAYLYDNGYLKWAGFYEEEEDFTDILEISPPITIYPATMAMGQNYSSSSDFLLTNIERGEEEEISGTVTVTSRAEGFEDVITPFYTFNNCLKVTTEVVIAEEEESIIIYTVSYLAPGIGLIKKINRFSSEEESFEAAYSEIVAYKTETESDRVEIDIPLASITIDGSDADWAEISPAYQDFTVIDVSGADQLDIENLYLARDNIYLYGYVTLNNVNLDDGDNIGLSFMNGPEGWKNRRIIILSRMAESNYSVSVMQSDDQDKWQGIWGQHSSGTTWVNETDNFGIEFKVPLSQLGPLVGKFLHMWAATHGSVKAEDALKTGMSLVFAGEHTLYFPHIASDPNIWETEIAIINTGDDQNLTGTLTAYDNDGNVVTTQDVNIQAHGKASYVVGDSFSSPETIGYIIFQGSGGACAGYEKFYTRDCRTRVALPAVTHLCSGDIPISHIASNATWWTGLSLVNLTNTAKNLNIEFSTGEQASVSLAAGEHKAFTIAQLFGGVKKPEIASGIIYGAEGIIGLELFGAENQLSGVLLKDSLNPTIFYPHIASNETWWTGLVLYNQPTNPTCNVVLRPYQDDGTLLATQDITLQPGGKYIGMAADLELPNGTAWFSLTADQPVTGFELFGTRNGHSLGGYTGVNISNTAGVFAKVTSEGWTGIAFVNTTATETTVALTAYDDLGSVVAATTVALRSHEKRVDTDTALFASYDITNATHIEFSCSNNAPVVGFQLNSSADGYMLDALPGVF